MTTQQQSTHTLLNLSPRLAMIGTALFGAMLTFVSPAQAADDTPDASCPVLPDLPGPDIAGAARLVIHLDEGRVIVEFDDQCYELDGRPLEVGYGDLDQLTVVFEYGDIAGPGQRAPTVPDIIIEPTEDDPEPS